MKPVAIRIFASLVLSILAFPAVSGGKSEYGDALKKTPEYKKITKPRQNNENDDDDSGGGGGYYYPHYHYHDPYYHRPAYARPSAGYAESAPARRSGRHGRIGLGVSIGDSEFDYDDIDDGDASLIRIGYRPDNSHVGYEFSFFDTGKAEVTSLRDIDIEVDSVNLALTYNSSTSSESTWNFVGQGGIYFADTTLTGPAGRVSEDSNGFLLGAAAELGLNRHFALRAEVLYFFDVEDFVDDETISYLGFGGRVEF